jgi:isoleucyl-tRNA synthetase
MTILPVLVPVTPHLAEDIWLSLPENQRVAVDGRIPSSAVLLPWPQVNQNYLNYDLGQEFETLLAIKETVNQALEVPRAEGHIGKSLDAQVWIQCVDDVIRPILERLSLSELEVLFNVSTVTKTDDAPVHEAHVREELPWRQMKTGSGIIVYAGQATNLKCSRCWKAEPTVGQMPGHAELCERCYQAVEQIG